MKIITIIMTCLLCSSVANYATAMPFNKAQAIYNRLVMKNKITNAPTLSQNNSSEINAYSNSRSIVVTKGMLISTNSEDEMAFVLGHELGHYVRHHSSSNYRTEYEADKYGKYFSSKAGYNSCRGVGFLRRFNDDGRGNHPPSRDRYNRVKC